MPVMILQALRHLRDDRLVVVARKRDQGSQRLPTHSRRVVAQPCDDGFDSDLVAPARQAAHGRERRDRGLLVTAPHAGLQGADYGRVALCADDGQSADGGPPDDALGVLEVVRDGGDRHDVALPRHGCERLQGQGSYADVAVADDAAHGRHNSSVAALGHLRHCDERHAPDVGAAVLQALAHCSDAPLVASLGDRLQRLNCSAAHVVVRGREVLGDQEQRRLAASPP
mmetsp:Transcript_98584/g.284427  ORF Transcript_98584/g.284427 Transcript_98584/m.284427 type:complete len:227 (+) Transcript_98584:355-1035(+)